jgi:hypothetical protein
MEGAWKFVRSGLIIQATIVTVDRADSETYRIEGKRKFRIFPHGPE